MPSLFPGLGALALPLIYFVHPAVARLTALIPPGVTWTAAATVAADMAVSGVLMKVTGNRDCLRWYQKRAEKAREGG